MKHFIARFRALELPLRNQALLWVLAFGVALFFAIYFDRQSSAKRSTDTETNNEESASTFIPAGFVLVPIEVANYESLDSILGSHGVVDLYTLGEIETKRRPFKVAERVKILRAPLNPSHFAVLVREHESQKLVAFSGAFTVVVQNPKHSPNGSGTGIVNATVNGEGASGNSPEDGSSSGSRNLSGRRVRSRISID